MDWNMVAALAGAASAVATATGLFFVTKQIRVASKIAAANFVLQLESEFTDHLGNTYQKFLSGSVWAPDQAGPAASDQVVELERYVDFFATLQILREKGLVSLDTIDKLFAYRFFIAVNNPHTVKVVKPNEQYWENLYSLYRDWAMLRQATKRPMPNEQYALVPVVAACP